MNTDSKRLLDELIEETAPAAFREALMHETLRRVRRRRRVRALNQGLSLVALFTVLLALAWRAFVFQQPSLEPAQVQPRRLEQPSYHLVRSQPLDQAMIVETRPGAVATVLSAPGGVAIVQTMPGDHLFHELTDEQLLGLLAGRPAALVRYSPQQAELLFLNPQDQNGFPVQ